MCKTLCKHDTYKTVTPHTHHSVEAALKAGGGGALQKVAKETAGSLQRLAASDFTGQSLLQLKKAALVMDFIHYVDVLDQLVKCVCVATAAAAAAATAATADLLLLLACFCHTAAAAFWWFCVASY